MAAEATIPTATEVNAYTRRLQVVREDVRRRGWGTQQRIAFGTEIAPTRVSGVLLMREVNEEYLARIERWLKEHPEARNET